MSPTQLTLRHLRDQGYQCWVVEYWNGFTHRRVDMFGCIDVVGVSSLGTIAVQTTAYSGVSERVKKVQGSEFLQGMVNAGWQVKVHGWRKVKNRWQVREVDVKDGLPKAVPNEIL